MKRGVCGTPIAKVFLLPVAVVLILACGGSSIPSRTHPSGPLQDASVAAASPSSSVPIAGDAAKADAGGPAAVRQEDDAEEPLDPASWKWVQEHFPSAEGYEPIQPWKRTLEKLLSWVPEGEKRNLFDQTCKPLPFTRWEGEGHVEKLVASLFVERRTEGSTRTDHYDSVVLGFDLVRECGGDEMFERQRNGSWKKTGTASSGCDDIEGRGLWKVDDAGAYYGGLVLLLDVAPQTSVVEEHVCPDGSTKVCRQTNWVLKPRVDPHYGAGGVGSGGSGHPVYQGRCDSPCPSSSSNEVDGRRASAILRGRRFVAAGGEASVPQVFRSLERCRDFRARHRVEAPFTWKP